ncbi:MAG: hydrolase [Planctomycetota bacterium]|jgi:nicotinamidase-related amidase
MLNAQDVVLAVIDVQGKLATLMHERDALIENISRMIRGAQVLEIPIVWTEQNPAGLGPTVPEIAKLMKGEPIGKFAFSCCAEEKFMEALRETHRRRVLLTGIEAHVCIYQTAADLLVTGYEVHIVTDAVSSRTFANKHLGLTRMKDLGAVMTSVEMALFEMLRVARGQKFKKVITIVK